MAKKLYPYPIVLDSKEFESGLSTYRDFCRIRSRHLPLCTDNEERKQDLRRVYNRYRFVHNSLSPYGPRLSFLHEIAEQIFP